MSKKSKKDDNTIAVNRQARFEYTLEQEFEAGLVLEGWEAKSLRAGKVQINEGHVILKRGEAWLIGTNITPLDTASTHINPDPTRTRKLLLHNKELMTLVGRVERQGYTIVPLKMYWKKGRAKCLIALAKGKQTQDKRQTNKDRDWKRAQSRVMKSMK